MADIGESSVTGSLKLKGTAPRFSPSTLTKEVLNDMFMPIQVTGTLKIETINSDLAESGYSMDAYENPNAQLAFHGASVHGATREEFEAALPEMQRENLVPQDGYFKPAVHPTEDEKRAHSWDKQ